MKRIIQIVGIICLGIVIDIKVNESIANIGLFILYFFPRFTPPIL